MLFMQDNTEARVNVAIGGYAPTSLRRLRAPIAWCVCPDSITADNRCKPPTTVLRTVALIPKEKIDVISTCLLVLQVGREAMVLTVHSIAASQDGSKHWVRGTAGIQAPGIRCQLPRPSCCCQTEVVGHFQAPQEAGSGTARQCHPVLSGAPVAAFRAAECREALRKLTQGGQGLDATCIVPPRLLQKCPQLFLARGTRSFQSVVLTHAVVMDALQRACHCAGTAPACQAQLAELHQGWFGGPLRHQAAVRMSCQGGCLA
mmetsp:Transcript_9415/g.26455  ORF Transcript_9415/g.26455 Transcript_9415/m.26455 type:complete len:260 (-) Transcript_9415:1618-2397(-)